MKPTKIQIIALSLSIVILGTLASIGSLTVLASIMAYSLNAYQVSIVGIFGYLSSSIITIAYLIWEDSKIRG